MAPSTDVLSAPPELNLSFCGAAQSTIALKRAKINPTFGKVRRAAPCRLGLRLGSKSRVGKIDHEPRNVGGREGLRTCGNVELAIVAIDAKSGRVRPRSLPVERNSRVL